MNKSLFDEVINVLVPYMRDQQSRRALTQSALFKSPIRNNIDWEGQPSFFTTNLVTQLIDYDGQDPELPSLIALLKEAKKYAGTYDQERIDALIANIYQPDNLTEVNHLRTINQSPFRQEANNGSWLKTWLLGSISVFVLFIAIALGLIPFLSVRSQELATQEAQSKFGTQTQIALALTPTNVTSSSSTFTPSITSTLLATPNATQIEETIQSEILAIQTEAKTTIIAQETATSGFATAFAQQTRNAQATKYVEATYTVESYTDTPTPDTRLTALARIQETQTMLDATATAYIWTKTPTVPPTQKPLPATNTSTSTNTQVHLPEEAFTPIAQNADWKVVEHSFNGVIMVLVPKGCFQMGSELIINARPENRQCFDAPYWIDKFEVTNGQFINHKGVATVNSFWTEISHPRENISWIEARDFCLLRGVRLPTEKEWEYAASGPEGWAYPWGNNWNGENAIWQGNSNSQTAAVGETKNGRSWVGALDMSGNVQEWTSSIYRDYPYTEDNEEELTAENILSSRRAARGGSRQSEPGIGALRNEYRLGYTASIKSINIGFRCVRPVQS